MKILLDTNILVAAFTAYGFCADVTSYCMTEHQIGSSEFILTELAEKLQKKFNFSKSESLEVSGFIRKIALIARYDENNLPKICRDVDDNHILAAAKVLEVDCIVTGDPDLLVLKDYAGIRILNPRNFWNWVTKQH